MRREPELLDRVDLGLVAVSEHRRGFADQILSLWRIKPPLHRFRGAKAQHAGVHVKAGVFTAHHIDTQVPLLLPGDADNVAQPGFVRHFKSRLHPVLDDQGHDLLETIGFRHNATLRRIGH
ncbi:hypothetical protein D3C85_1628780 [compost metagenome]